MVDLMQAKQHLRVLHDDEDALIGSYLNAALAWAKNYTDFDFAGAEPIPADLAAAVLLVVGHLYENRAAVTASAAVEIPLGAQILAHPYRTVRV